MDNEKLLLHNGRKLFRIPRWVATQYRVQTAELHLIPSFQCNNHCIFCSAGSPRPDRMDTSHLLRAAKSFLEPGLEPNVVISGGEPTIDRDFITIVESVREWQESDLVREHCVLTNGSKFANRSFLSECISAGLQDVVLSVYGQNAAEHDVLTRTKGSFSKVMKAAHNLAEMGVNLHVRGLVTKKNASRLDAFVEFLFTRLEYAHTFSLQCLHYEYRALEHVSDLAISYSALWPYLREAQKVANTYRKRLHLSNFPVCVAGQDGRKIFSIDGQAPDKMIIVGADYEKGDVIPRTAKWTGPCENCSVRFVCCGLSREYISLFSVDEARPVPDPCNIAKESPIKRRSVNK